MNVLHIYRVFRQIAFKVLYLWLSHQKLLLQVFYPVYQCLLLLISVFYLPGQGMQRFLVFSYFFFIIQPLLLQLLCLLLRPPEIYNCPVIPGDPVNYFGCHIYLTYFLILLIYKAIGEDPNILTAQGHVSGRSDELNALMCRPGLMFSLVMPYNRYDLAQLHICRKLLNQGDFLFSCNKGIRQ